MAAIRTAIIFRHGFGTHGGPHECTGPKPGPVGLVIQPAWTTKRAIDGQESGGLGAVLKDACYVGQECRLLGLPRHESAGRAVKLRPVRERAGQSHPGTVGRPVARIHFSAASLGARLARLLFAGQAVSSTRWVGWILISACPALLPRRQ